MMGAGDVVSRDGCSRPSPISRARPLWLERAREDVEALRQPGAVALVGVGPGERTGGLVVLDELGRALGTAPVSITENRFRGLSELPVVVLVGQVTVV